ncbi:MAG: MotA/TolQ/ExbB proton channel family protein [Roseobacter sp.]|jgi:biopolymer transport protein ExbB|nr:MotA/TolQ/ExbB proton channel family protein [Roseobacter sp.]
MVLSTALTEFLTRGGPTLWLIGALSVLLLALILWKTWRMLLAGAWSGSATEIAVAAWQASDAEAALSQVAGRRSLRARIARVAMETQLDPDLSDAQAREETARCARADLAEARRGLRALELIATIAPLLGLLGTVLGMIDAFQALQEAGNRADPAALAGGIWEALLTTAAGMSVAIPAGIALAWFESLCDRLQGDLEDIATRVFIRGPGQR